MYTEGTLNAIRNALSIVDVISEYVPLKRSGQGFSGLCPFHSEKTPSFHVHPLKQIFHCFGCQKGGNVFTFVTAVEGINFPEAVQRLAKRAGITLEEEMKPRARHAQNAQAPERVGAALEWAAKYFQHLLLKVPDYQFARDYLKKRGINEKSIEKFRIGVAPRGWSTLLELMTKRGYQFEELVESGLVVAREGSKTQGYDRFRERLIFPIRNVEDQVMGFGARLLRAEDNQPKYLNSSESSYFSKRRCLYGIFENQRGIRLKSEAIIVEGYMDVVGLSENGVDNAIATMGTALTEEHCQFLKSFCNRVVTVFDPDTGGKEAWHRSVSLFLSYGIFAKDITLPDGLDPDEFIQKEGKDTFYELCEKAPRQVTKLIKEIASRGSLSEEQRAEFLDQLTPILIASRRLPDRALLWDSISLVLKVSVESLKILSEPANRPGAAPQTSTKKDNKKDDRVLTTGATSSRPSGLPPGPKLKPLDALDLEFLDLVLRFPAEFEKIPKEQRVIGVRSEAIRGWLEKLTAAENAEAWEKILNEMAAEELDPRLQTLASGPLLARERVEAPVSKDGPDKSQLLKQSSMVKVVYDRLCGRAREIEIKALSAQVRLTEKLGNDEEGLRLLGKLKDLRSS